MPTPLLHDLIARAYQAYDHGLRGFLTELFHDDIEMIVHAPAQSLPMPTRVRGKAAVLAAMGQVDAVHEVVRNDLQAVVIEGDTAAVMCDRTLRSRRDGRLIQYRAAIFHRFREGRLVLYEVFIDGVDLLGQTLNRKIVLPSA